MIINFLIDSRYGGPQMIHNHLKKNIFRNQKTIYFDKKNNKFNFSNLKRLINLLFFLDIIINLLVLIKNRKYFFKYKIFFVYSIVNIVPIIYGILTHKKIIWYILEKPNFSFYFLFKILNFYSNIKVICISDSLGKKLKIKNYEVYFPAINMNFWKKTNLNINQKKILEITCVGNLNKTKNPFQLINFLLKSKKKFNLNIIGKSLTTQKSYNKKLQLLIKNSNKSTLNKIKIHQNKKSKFIKKILNKTDLYILPSISEGLSISLVEAMSMERICLVSKPSNHSKIIKNKQNGFEFNLNQNSFLQTLSHSIALNNSTKNKIIKKARYTIKKIIDKNLNFEKKLKISLL